MLSKSKAKVHTREIIEQQQQNNLRLNQVISDFTKVSLVTLAFVFSCAETVITSDCSLRLMPLRSGFRGREGSCLET